MEPSLRGHAPAFQKVLDDFRCSLAQDDRDEFRYTTLEDLQSCILEIQEKHASERKVKNMTRLNSFLEAMEQYGNVIEVFLNTSEFLAFVWVRNYLCTERKPADAGLYRDQRSFCCRYFVSSEIGLTVTTNYTRLHLPSLKHSMSC